MDLEVPGPDGGGQAERIATAAEPNRLGSAMIPVREYVPAEEPWATLVWAHGGSFVHGNLDWPEADWVSRSFAEQGVRVFSVDYVLASDTVKAPAPARDVQAVVEWVAAQADDGLPLFVGGASAGANLAVEAALSLTTDEASDLQLSGVLAEYPTFHRVARMDAEIDARAIANSVTSRFPMSAVAGMYEMYLGELDTFDGAPLVVGERSRTDLATLPPVLMVNADVDDLRTSGEDLAAQLRDAGTEVEVQMEPGTVHGYMNRPGDVRLADTDVDALRAAGLSEAEIADPARATIARFVGMMRRAVG